jgi:hypothetical protein
MTEYLILYSEDWRGAIGRPNPNRQRIKAKSPSNAVRNLRTSLQRRHVKTSPAVHAVYEIVDTQERLVPMEDWDQLGVWPLERYREADR